MGPYNNEEGIYLDTPGYLSGHWYVNEQEELYLVPDAEAEIEGPDDDILEQLNTIYREFAFETVDTDIVAARLGLTVVADSCKRFDEACGYFVA